LRTNRWFAVLTAGIFALNFGGCQNNSYTDPSSTTGEAGSMSRFAIIEDTLYAINSAKINAIDISIPTAPLKASRTDAAWGIETLFAYNNYLYVGAFDGMYIYEQEVSTGDLTLVGHTSHARSCDPVIVSQDVAYVTLHAGGGCSVSNTNVLELYNVSDPSKVTQILSKNMWEPKGLDIDGNQLFVCDGDAGLKVYDINRTATEVNATYTDINVTLTRAMNDSTLDCYDLIAHNNILYISNEDSIVQYSYTGETLTKLSTISQ